MAQHLETSEDTVERIERRNQGHPNHIRHLCAIYGIAPSDVGSDVPVDDAQDGAALLTLSRIATGARLEALIAAADAIGAMETTVVAWHRRIASVQRLSSESARNAFRTLDTLIDDRSHTVVFDGVLSKIDFEIAASEHLAALRRHGLYLYGLPFLVVQQHIDAEIRPIVTPCVAVGVTDMDSSAMVVSQNPAPLVGSYRNYFEEICPISTW